MRARLMVPMLGVFLAGVVFALVVQRRMPDDAAATSPRPSAPSPAAASSAAPSSASSTTEDLTPEETRNIDIFRRASASVLNITSIKLQRDFFSMDVFQIPQGSGSGFVWDREGHIV